MYSLAMLLAFTSMQTSPLATPAHTLPGKTSETKTSEKLSKSLDSLGLPHAGVTLDTRDSDETRGALVEDLKATYSDDGTPARERKPSRPKN